MVLILLVEATVLVEADICFFNFQLMHDKIISVPNWITNCLLLMPGDAALNPALSLLGLITHVHNISNSCYPWVLLKDLLGTGALLYACDVIKIEKMCVNYLQIYTCYAYVPLFYRVSVYQ